MYHDQPSGLGPEEVTFKGVGDIEREQEAREKEKLYSEVMAKAKAEAANGDIDIEEAKVKAMKEAGIITKRVSRVKPKGKVQNSKVEGKPSYGKNRLANEQFKLRKDKQKEANERDRWVNAVRKWREEVDEGGARDVKGGGAGMLIPPGLNEVDQALPTSYERDYLVTHREYILRPEVNFYIPLSYLVPTTAQLYLSVIV